MHLRRFLPGAVAVAAVAAMSWPWPLRPTHVVGSPAMEADNHLWMLWRATQAAGVWENFPVGDARPLMDVVHLPLFALLAPIDPASAYGALFVADVAIALLGGYLLAREAGADEDGALVGMVALGTAPFLGGALVFGLSEAWPIGAYALHGALLLRVARRGRAGDALLSGAALAAFALAGWYQAFFAALGAPVWLLWAWRAHRPDRRRFALIVASGVLAVALVAPAFAWFVAHADVGGLLDRPLEAWQPRGDWRHGHGGGADPLALVTPTLERTELARTAYLGVVALVLAVVGAARPGGGRLAWWGIGLFAILAMGRWLTIAGRPIGGPLPLPAAWLAVLPGAGAIAGWYRAAGVASVFVAAAAAVGATRLVHGRRGAPALAAALAVAVGADAIGLSDAPWPRPTYDPRPPAELLAVPGRGPVVLLPFDHGERRWPERVPRAYQRWQPWLGRPISENYEGPDALLDNPLLAWADRECAGGRAPRDARFAAAPPPETAPDAATAAAAADELRRLGVEAIVLVEPRAATPNRCAAVIGGAFGPPRGDGDVARWWAL